MVMKRKYGHCAKCGAEKSLDVRYVGECCAKKPGLYTHCAVGGERVIATDGHPYIGRCYICYDHLARKVGVVLL